MHPQLRDAQNVLKKSIESQTVASDMDAAPPAPLKVEWVRINGAPKEGSFVQKLDGYQHGDPTQRMDFAVKFLMDGKAEGQASGGETDIRAIDSQVLKKALLGAVEDTFRTVPLKEQGPGGERTLAERYDFTGRTPEIEKPVQEQLTDVQKLVAAGIEEAKAKGAAIPPEHVALLTNPLNYDETKSSVFGYSDSAPTVSGKGFVMVSFSVNASGEVEGGTSNSAMVKENIESRKAEILAAVADKAVAMRAAAGAAPDDLAKLKEDLGKLDMQVESYGNDAWKQVTVSFGNKLTEAEKTFAEANGIKVGETQLKTFESKDLAKILNDSLLFAGPDAQKADYLIAGSSDIRRILEENRSAAPENFGKALDTPILRDALYGQERIAAEEKDKATAKIVPVVSVLSGLNAAGEIENTAHVLLDLPKGQEFKDVIPAIAAAGAQRETIGSATQRLADQARPQIVITISTGKG